MCLITGSLTLNSLAQYTVNTRMRACEFDAGERDDYCAVKDLL